MSIDPTLYFIFWGILQSMRILRMGSSDRRCFLLLPSLMFY